MTRPNVLFILSDQHRFSDVGYAGNTAVATPNLDELSRAGARFDRAYANCPVCVPARGTLLTGLHALAHGAASNDLPIRTDVKSVADVLNDAGYRTAYVGKWHLGGVPRDQFIDKDRRLGFRYWRGRNCNHDYLNAYYDDDENVRHRIKGYEPFAQTELALEFLKNRGDAPWALFLCFGTPHDPYLWLPEGEAEALKEPPLRENAREWTEGGFIPGPGHHAHGLAPGSGYRMEDLPRMLAGYYRHIEHIDECVGRVLGFLGENGLEDDTIVVYTSDHGDMLGSHGLTFKQWYFEESAHIPLVIRWPGRVEPGARAQLITIADLAPTLLGMIGLRFLGAVDGHDLSDCALRADGRGADEAYLYSIIPCHQAWRREIGSWRALVRGNFKYAANEDETPLALYDLKCDPFEEHNLLGAAAPALLTEMREALRAHVSRFDGFVPWQRLTIARGLGERWDKSQLHFGYPPIEDRDRT